MVVWLAGMQVVLPQVREYVGRKEALPPLTFLAQRLGWLLNLPPVLAAVLATAVGFRMLKPTTVWYLAVGAVTGFFICLSALVSSGWLATLMWDLGITPDPLRTGAGGP
jgi:hypothetical protein